MTGQSGTRRLLAAHGVAFTDAEWRALRKACRMIRAVAEGRRLAHGERTAARVTLTRLLVARAGIAGYTVTYEPGGFLVCLKLADGFSNTPQGMFCIE